jgi:hypothetical protein
MSNYYAPPVTGFYIVYGKKIFLESGSHVRITGKGEVEYFPPVREVRKDSAETTSVGSNDGEHDKPRD